MKKIFETCDSIKTETDEIFYDDDEKEIYPFIVNNDYTVNVGDCCKDHYSIKNNEHEIVRGRIFIDDKIISFWDLEEIDSSKYREIFNSIENIFGLSLNEFRIDIPVDKKFKSNKYFTYENQYGYYALVPVKDFINNIFNIRNDDIAKNAHLLKVKDKWKYLKDSGYKPKMKNWKEWQKPFESADSLMFNDVHVQYDNVLTFPFTIDIHTKDVYFAQESNTHEYLHQKGIIGFDGRLFVKQKIISFWELETDTLEIILKKIQNKFNKSDLIDDNIDFFDGSWFIDVFLSDDIFSDKNNEKYYNLLKDKYYTYNIDKFRKTEGVIVPLLDFIDITNGKVSIEKDEELYKQHLLNWENKQRLIKQGKLKVSGGSKKVKNWKEWQKPFESKLYESPSYVEYVDSGEHSKKDMEIQHNLTLIEKEKLRNSKIKNYSEFGSKYKIRKNPLEWQQAKRTSESVNECHFPELFEMKKK